MTTRDVASWVAKSDNEAREWVDAVLPNEAHELRHICVLPVFLGRWYGTSPAEATAVIEAAVQERRIELDSEGQDARPHHNPHYHALLHKDHPEYRTIIGNGKSDK